MLGKLLDIIDGSGGTWTIRKKQGLPLSNLAIIVSVEDFFDKMPPGGYYFAANAGFGDEKFYILFNKIKEERTVQDIWIEIHDYDPDEDEYPYAEVCYISTTACKDEVVKWFSYTSSPSNISICENDVGECLALIREGYKLFCCWWD